MQGVKQCFLEQPNKMAFPEHYALKYIYACVLDGGMRSIRLNQGGKFSMPYLRESKNPME